MQKPSFKNLNNYLLRFPKITVFLSGGLAKFCFCKGLTVPFLFFPMIYVLLLNIQRPITNQYIKSSFVLGYCFGLGYFGSTLYWVAESFKCVGLGNYGYVAVMFLVAYLAVYTGLVTMLTKIFSKTKVDLLLIFSFFWVFMEYLRGIVFTGFPWNLAGYVTYDIPYFAQIADIFGIYGVSLIFILIISLLTYKKTIISAVWILVITLLYGYYKVEIYDGYINPKDRNLVTVIQPSIPQEQKMDMRFLKDNIDKYIDISNTEEIYKGKKLVIWPEAAINIPINNHQKILEYIGAGINHSDTFIVTGADRRGNGRELYNGLSVINKQSEIIQSYDKRHLLPFGEFIPEFLLNIGLRKVIPGTLNFSSGLEKRTIKIEGFEQFDAVICYEIAFPGEIVDDKESKWILNITNDSWFKDSDGPTQHLKIACFRAIEEGRAIARCANNGISCIINCNGQITKELKTDEVGKINSIMPQKYCDTFFSKYHNNTILILLGLGIAFIRTRSRLHLLGLRIMFVRIRRKLF